MLTPFMTNLLEEAPELLPQQKTSGLSFVYHVLFDGEERIGALQRSITVAFACTT